MRASREGWARRLLAAALLSAMVLAAQSELELARAVGWPDPVSWFAPVALDGYVLAAVLVGRHVGRAMLVVGASVFASHAVYAAPAAWDGGHLVWPLAAVCSAVPLLVAWRVHGLLHPVTAPAASPQARPAARPAAKRPPVVDAPTATPAATAAAVRPRLVAVDDDPFPDGRGQEVAADQVAWFTRHLAEHPKRTHAEWAEVTGLALRTVRRRLAAARGEHVGDELEAAQVAR